MTELVLLVGLIVVLAGMLIAAVALGARGARNKDDLEDERRRSDNLRKAKEIADSTPVGGAADRLRDKWPRK